jgi:integrase/recombinase XerD
LDLRRFSSFVTKGDSSRLIVELDRLAISDFLKSLDGLKARTIRRKLATLKSLFAYLERECHIESSPIHRLRLQVRVGRQLPRSTSLESIKSLLAVIRKQLKDTTHSYQRRVLIRDLAIFETLFLSGMRVGELSHLRVQAVNLETQSILISGKGNRERKIPLCSKPTALAVMHHMQANSRNHPDAFLFINRCGVRLSEQSIRTSLHRYAKDAGLGTITPHMIRHTVATLLLARGAHLRSIQILLGHSSIATTTLYTHVDDSAQREILSALHPRNLFR